MKRSSFNILTLLAASAALTLQSCDDQLDLKPISNTVVGEGGQGTAGSFITNATTAEAALSGCYAYFKTDGGEYYVLDYFLIGDAQSDNAYAGADNPSVFEVDEFRMQSTNQMAERDWRYLYNHITRCNAVIVNVPKVTDPALTDARKAQIIGEAKFIRARAYFDLVRLYGGVPLVLGELPTITSDNIAEVYPQLFPARASVEEVLAQIIQDLNEAATSVPATAANKGFVTTGAVHTLLAKVYATQSPANWEQVIANTDKVISSGYSLVDNYENLWDGTHENSSEAIFELNFDNWDTGGNWGTFMFYGTDWKKFMTPSNDLIKTYEAEGDKVRLGSAIWYAPSKVGWTDKFHPLNHFPLAYKMRKEDGTQNVIMYRLADVLLLKAEALNETGNTKGALALVNQIRARVNLAPVPAADQATIRLAIDKERRLELAFEGHRWFDLKRDERLIPVMQAVKDGSNNPLNYQVDANDLVWPLPQAELDQNTNLTQNPGY